MDRPEILVNKGYKSIADALREESLAKAYSPCWMLKKPVLIANKNVPNPTPQFCVSTVCWCKTPARTQLHPHGSTLCGFLLAEDLKNGMLREEA